jgi:hypothetical protein
MGVFLLGLIKRRLFSVLNCIFASSVVLTLSLWGIIGFVIFLAACAIEALLTPGKGRRIRAVAQLLLLGAVLVVVAASTSRNIIIGGVDFLNHKASIITDSGLDKVQALETFKQELPNVLLIGKPLAPGFCPYCRSPQDAGVGMNGVYYFGLFLFGTLVLLTAYRLIVRWNISFVAMLALLLVWKANPYDPMLWVIFGYVLSLQDGPARFAECTRLSGNSTYLLASSNRCPPRTLNVRVPQFQQPRWR